ncbi:uncharacterized protein TRIVIDRAFT_65553 [Trichoderma virens Gv29-8]|uniref:Uncharacterized protein n=1 Tax=Hypocrea virens (strain Gv29-8 / FGSC 10586) TaxID=413071 RepID=G9N9S4_HYPVG|nr:uncharacterized protein TRIVIDRAFT_65553 [Trichoderma virens Gv29-8]EHK16692.1 hypothetical protein TRIVIDRAFT_65553 [Trichoderma virens Gv29-8]
MIDWTWKFTQPWSRGPPSRASSASTQDCKSERARRGQMRLPAEMHAGTWPISLHQVPASTSGAPCYRKLYRKCWALVVFSAPSGTWPVLLRPAQVARDGQERALAERGCSATAPCAKRRQGWQQAGRGAIRFQPARMEAKTPCDAPPLGWLGWVRKKNLTPGPSFVMHPYAKDATNASSSYQHLTESCASQRASLALNILASQSGAEKLLTTHCLGSGQTDIFTAPGISRAHARNNRPNQPLSWQNHMKKERHYQSTTIAGTTPNSLLVPQWIAGPKTQPAFMPSLAPRYIVL